jgi:hypothetical protein
MPIALAIPFAEAAGIAIAGLSAAAIADKVNEYIKLNPEDSMTIFKMITPASAGEGLSTLFKKKAKKEKEKEPSIEDLEEIGEDLSQADKAKVMKAYGKSKGAGKRQRMIDIATKLGLAGEGKERQKTFDEVEGRYEDSDFEEERPKPKFDYTKFFKANGGRIGFANGGESIIGIDLKEGDNIQSNINAIKAAATVPYNFAKGLIGNFQDPMGLTTVSLTDAQKARLNEIAQSKGTPTGNISYADYGSPTKTFSGIYPETMSPLDASLATTMGATNFRTNPDNTIEFLGGKYDFNKGSNPIYNFIDEGGLAGLIYRGGEKLYDTVSKINDFFFPAAAAADFQNGQMLKPADKFDDQGRKLVSESMVNNIFNNEAYNGEQLKAAFGDNVSFVSDDYYSSAPNFNADVLREEEDAQYNLPKTSGIINSFLNMKDAVPQMLLGAATKVPGAGLVLGGLNSLGNFLGNTFENRQLTGDGVIVDEFGRSYNADELNAQNALGGYYTEAARSSRRRDASIRNMLARQAAGKAISETRLAAFQEQAAREEAARQAATARQAAQNAATYGTSEATGGYQSSWGGVSDFMSGSGTSADMGSFANGGLATMFRKR